MEAYKIKIMADYQCYPLWGNFGDCQGNINPDNLPISNDLRNALERWQAVYDKILVLDDPGASGFKTVEAETEFEKQGVVIWQQLAQVLRGIAKVSYYSEINNREFFDFADYVL